MNIKLSILRNLFYKIRNVVHVMAWNGSTEEDAVKSPFTNGFFVIQLGGKFFFTNWFLIAPKYYSQ